ncbi:MAG: YlbF family regulator [Clostridia bacterium]|nr:YlbF family regulator [Clostridia bacterium]
MSLVLNKAKELAEAITECPELLALRDAEIAMGKDPGAQEIIAEFQEKQREFQEAVAGGKELTTEQEAARDALEEKMENNEFIRGYFEAQQKLENLLQAVNMVVGRAISGEDVSECGPGCSSCGSGSGCC